MLGTCLQCHSVGMLIILALLDTLLIHTPENMILGHFGVGTFLGTFWCKIILVRGHFGGDILVGTFWCGDILDVHQYNAMLDNCSIRYRQCFVYDSTFMLYEHR